MTTFGLVHGAWHGGWCWERLVPELEARGHRAITMDLPCDDASATFEDYAGVVTDALTDAPDDVVLVGHSMAGQTIPLVAARRPVARLVYLCALLPAVGRSLVDQLGGEPDMLDVGYVAGLGEIDEQGRTAWVDPEVARRYFYADCDEADARAAFDRLRPQAQTPYAVTFPLDAFPAVPASYIVCTEDHLVVPAWSRRAAKERLGLDAVELPGSHSPFLSRPAELADLLTR